MDSRVVSGGMPPRIAGEGGPGGIDTAAFSPSKGPQRRAIDTSGGNRVSFAEGAESADNVPKMAAGDTSQAGPSTAAGGPSPRKRGQSVGTKWKSTISRITRARNLIERKATETVFPSARALPHDYNPRSAAPGDTAPTPVSEVESSVSLQALLYFNTWFSPVFLVMHVMLDAWRSANVETPQEFAIVSPLVLVLWCCNEPVRLGFGWAGNTQEKVPHLGTFFLLTLFPTLPCSVFFTLAAPNRVPGDVALGLVLLGFNVAQVAVAAYTIKALIRSQTEKFYLMQFGEPADPLSADA